MSDGMAFNGLKFTKFLESWSGGSKVGVRDSTCWRAHTHTSYHITSHWSRTPAFYSKKGDSRLWNGITLVAFS